MMSAKTVRYALGLLQDEPENREAIADLYRALGFSEETVPVTLDDAEETLRLLESARRGHERRRELEAAYRLLRVETAIRPDRADAVSDLMRFAEFELLDDREVVRLADAVLATDPQNSAALGAKARAGERSTSWTQTATQLVAEANKVDDETLRAALYARAADLVFRYARPGDAIEPAPASMASVNGKKKRKKKGGDDDSAAPPSVAPTGTEFPIVTWLESALRADPNNRAALHLYLRTLRLEGRWEDLGAALQRAAENAASKEERVQYLLLRARLLHKKLEQPDEAATLYESVLDLAPGHAEATSQLVDSYTARELWDHLVTLYEEQLRSGLVPQGQEVGLHLQVAMIRWRMQSKLDQAAAAFDRVRRFEPAHPGMLQFFRDYTAEKGERGRLVEVLNDAYRALPEGEARTQVGTELASLAEETENAQKAIEQYRALLRQDPANQGARDGLRRLYRQTGAMNALVDLLRGELDRTPPDAIDERARVLREIADVYRNHTKSDSALVSVLSQLSQILPEDKDVLRELVLVYEKLGRHRDVLLAQDKLAILEEEPAVRAEIYRVVARKWLEQFTNVQNAIETYEKLREVQPKDREARDKLRELYTKRRAYRPLAELLRQEIALADEPEEKRSMLAELARLAAERLDQGADAIQLYKRLLLEFPDDQEALDALERYAEREKDFATVAEVLERRAELDPGEGGAVALQKLGAIYTERVPDAAKAKRAWLQVLERQPGNPKALRVLRDLLVAARDYDGLEEVYERAGDVDALVDVFSTAADRTSDPEQKIELSLRVADLCEGKLNAPERAFRAYERILSVRPNDLRAARALIPLYENDGRHAKAVPLYEVQVLAAESAEEKVELYTRLQRIAERELKDGEAAVRYARLAYELEPTEARLAALESVAAATGGFVNFAAAIEGRVRDDATPPAERRALRKRLAELARARGRVDDALAAYQALLEEDADDEDVLGRLDALLRESGKHDELRELYDRRVARANTARKAKLLEEWAELEETAFEAKSEAARVYERLIEVVPQHGGALRALSRLYGELGDGEGALRVLERDRDAREGVERAAREIEIANVLEARLQRPARAMDAVKRALELDPDNTAAMAVVERLLPRPETRAEAASLLETHYDATSNYDKQVGVLEVAIATRASKSDRMGLYAKLANVQERRGQPEAAFEVIARAIEEYPGELEVWDTFERLARATRRVAECGERLARLLSEGALSLPETVRVELLRKAARIFEDDLGDIDRARPYLETLHARDPKDSAVFERLKQVLTTRERWDELTKLYESQIEAEPDAPTRIGLLEDAAIVAEEMRGDAALAARYFEQILREDPTHEDASRALEKIHREHGAHAELARILTLRLEHGGGDPNELRLELARIHLGPLEDKRKAADYLDQVLTAEPLMHDARLLLEGLLSDGALRAEVARVLERVHDARDDARALVAMLEIRLETTTPDEEEDLLRRIATLRDERLTDDAGAFEAYGRLFPRVPDDEELRDRLLLIGRRLGHLQPLARVFEEALASEALTTQKARLAFELGQIYRELGDMDRAAQSFERARAAARPQDSLLSDALRELDTLYQRSADAEALRGVLEAAAEHPDFSAERGALFRRLGILARDRQNDSARAVTAFERALGEDDADVQALSALTALYESASAFEKLADNLRRREQLAENPEERRAMALELARVLSDNLQRTGEAIDQYRSIVADFGPTDELFARLAFLYRQSDRYEDLAAVHEERARFTDDPRMRLIELLSSGQVHKDQLGDPQSALAMFREALTLDPESHSARRAVEEMTSDPSVGREAAEMLVPLYEAGADRGQLLRMLRVQIDLAEDLDEKLQKLERATLVAEQDDAGAALDYAAEATRLAQDEPVLPSLLETLERLAARSGKYLELAIVYRDLAEATSDEDRKFESLLRLAQLEDSQLGDPPSARKSYERAAELRPDDERALEPLQGLLERVGDHAALSPLLARRAELSDDPQTQKRLLKQRADLLHQKLADNAAAIDVLEAILDLGFDARVAGDLGALYMEEQRFGDLVALYERELGEDGGRPERRAELHLLLGRVFEASLDEPERALDAYEATLALDPGSQGARDAIERFLVRTDLAERAAEALEPVYVQRRDWDKLAETLEARVRANEEPQVRIELLSRLAKLREEQEENYAGALEAMGRVLIEDPRDHATWSELERLARVAGAESRLAQMFVAELDKVENEDEDTAALAEKTGILLRSLNDPERALVYFKRHLAFAPESAHASFRAIDDIYSARGLWEERAALHRDALAYREEPEARLQTLHVIAALEEHELRRPEKAVETFRQCLDVDPEDRSALDSLERLLADLQRWPELADLLLRIAETTSDPRREARVRLELGAIQHQRQARTAEAIDQYERVLELFDLDGPGATASAALEAMLPEHGQTDADPERTARILEILEPAYQRADAWQKRIGLALVRERAAGDPHDRVQILRERAKLLEERAGDRQGAFAALEEAFVLDPASGELREELERLAEKDARWDELAVAYEAGLAALDEADDLGRRELLLALATLHDVRRDDPRAALSAYGRLVSGEEADPDLLAKVEELATLLSDWNVLVRVLQKKAEAAFADDERASFLRHMGEIRRDMLEDPAGAIEAYEKALEIEPESAFTVDMLIELYVTRSEPARLAALYRQRIELAEAERPNTDAEDVPALDASIFDLLNAAAAVYETTLEDRREAIELYRRADELSPKQPEVLARLEKLYVAENMTRELLENLRAQREIVAGSEDRRALLIRIAAIHEGESDFPDALTSYRAVLEERFDADIAARMFAIAEAHADFRGEVAAFLEPQLRQEQRHAELVRALRWRADEQGEAEGKVQATFAVAEVEEQGLGDAGAAFRTLSTLVAEAPAHDELHERMNRLAAVLGKDAYASYADLIAKENENQFDAEIGKVLSQREATIAERQLDDPARAAKALRRALEQGGDDEHVLGELARLYRALDQQADVAEVLERRAELVSDPMLIADIFAELGDLFAKTDPGRALASYRASLERVSRHEAARRGVEALLEEGSLFDDAFETLEALYREAEDKDAQVALHDRRIRRAGDKDARIAARMALAEVMANDPPRAQKILEDALAEDPHDETVQQALEAVVVKTGELRSALSAYGRALEAIQHDGDAAKANALWKTLGQRYQSEVSDPDSAERAYEHALQLAPDDRAALDALIELRRGPGREADRFTVLRQRARLAADKDQKESDYREAFALSAQNPESAEALLREALADNDSWTFALDELATLKRDSIEGAELLLRRAELSAGDEARDYRLRAAESFERHGDRARAVGLYAELVADAPLEGVAPERLRAAYQADGNVKALASLLESQIDAAESVERRSELRLELATLQLEQGDADRAAALLRAVLDEEPRQSQALASLLTVYERLGKHEELAELLGHELARVREEGDRSAELRLHLRLGGLFEAELADKARALGAYAAAMDLSTPLDGSAEDDAQLARALTDVARLGEEQRAWDVTERALRHLVERSKPEELAERAERLAVVRKQQGDTQGAIDALRTALQADPDRSDARRELTQLLRGAERWEELARALVDEAEHGRERAGAAIPATGSIPPRSGPVSDVLSLYLEAADIHMKQRGVAADAATVLERASSAVPENREVLLALCDAFVASGREREAAAVLERIIQSFGGKRVKELALYHHRLGKALVGLGERERALAEYDMAFKIDPGNVVVLRDLGVLALDSGDLERAQKTFRALLIQKLDPGVGLTKGEVFEYLGQIAEKQGDKAKAIDMYKRALDNDPSRERAKAGLEALK